MTDRRPYDTAALQDAADRLVATLTRWQDGDDSKAHVRRAGSRAVDAMNELQVWLHANRARLVTELRESDDAAAARADRILAGDDDG